MPGLTRQQWLHTIRNTKNDAYLEGDQRAVELCAMLINLIEADDVDQALDDMALEALEKTE